ncbi:glycogen-binding subunit 76A-like [Saccoglossus kowalevskii]
MSECTAVGCWKTLVVACSDQWSTSPYGHQPKPRKMKYSPLTRKIAFRARGNFDSLPCNRLPPISEPTSCLKESPRILRNSLPLLKRHTTDQRKHQKKVHFSDHYPEQKYLAACFSLPTIDKKFLNTVKNQKVSLENVAIADLTILGKVRVANIAFHKTVKVRFTANGWKNFYDIQACYVKGSCDGPTDKFAFGITPPRFFDIGDRIELAILYEANGQTYWDNNNKENYVFECFTKTKHRPNIDTLWTHFM